MRLFDILGVLYEPINTLDNHDHLLSYIEPELNADGSCPIYKVPGKTYDLRQYVQTPNSQSTEQQQQNLLDLLARLNRLVRWIHIKTDVLWFGIYLRHGDKLVKYVYNGEMSKAEFVISEEYLEKSINTRVIMEKKLHYIPDVDTHTGPYYRCDAKVKSELCCPIFSPDGKVIGIFDCEDHRKNFFDDKIDFLSDKVKRAIEIFLEDHPYITHSNSFNISEDEFSKDIAQ
jgi:putative methionine-R-sulfoxide reductase with GAF domain